MREEIRASESVFEESVTLRDRKARQPLQQDSSIKAVPTPTESPEPEAEPQQAESKPMQPRRETSKRRRGQTGSYDEVFLKHKELKIRQSVYISQETHASVVRHIHLLGMAGKEISVGVYIDNMVAEHLESHKEFFDEMRRQQLEQG